MMLSFNSRMQKAELYGSPTIFIPLYHLEWLISGAGQWKQQTPRDRAGKDQIVHILLELKQVGFPLDIVVRV